MPEARDFRGASLGGNPVGRPRTANLEYQFAGTQRDLSGPERALIAARRWQTARGDTAGGNAAGGNAAGGAGSPAEGRAFREAAAAWYAGGGLGERPYRTRRSADSQADRGFAKRQWSEGRRLPNENGFFNPDSKAEGGSGTSAKNPWA